MRTVRLLRLLGVVAMLALAAPSMAAPPERSGTIERDSYTNEAGTRQYVLYVPSKVDHDAPLLVYLHGCNQTADDAVLGTRLNELAAEKGFPIVYPEQDPAANGSRCWNWFLPEHQARDSGEPSIVAGITREMAARFRTQADRVFVFGVSAGGAMSSIMTATYPDLYRAGAILAAPAFGGVDVTGELAFQAMGDNARAVPVIIFQGTADALVNYPLGRTALTQWVGTNDLADDGERNDSVTSAGDPEHHAFDQDPRPGSGDLCIPPPPSFPCAGGAVGFQEGYPYSIERYVDGAQEVVVEFWSIHGMGHAYPGGNPDGNFVDPLGPDIGRAAFDFFLQHADDRGRRFLAAT